MNFHSLNLAIDNAFTWAWKTSLQATLLIALVWLIQNLLRRWLAPRWRYALGLLIVLRLLLPVVPQSSFSIFNLTSRFVSLRPPTFDPAKTPNSPTPSQLPATPVTVAKAANQIQPSVRKFAPVQFAGFVWISGFVALLIQAIAQQRKLARQLRQQQPLIDPRVIELLENCKTSLRISRNVTVYATSALSTPALFGHWRPCLLVPEELLRRLDEQELRLIAFHELTHLKRGDILANWLIIIARSLHWFNPFVWFAMKRLRADQELACDAAVMARLADDERKLYGETLLKLLADFSASPLCPGVVPFITKKQLIKRRISMIAKFKPASRIAVIGSTILLVALSTFTLTRAAEKPATQPTPTADPVSPGEPPAYRTQMEASERTIKALQEELDKLSQQLRYRQNELSDLRKNLNIPSEIAEGKAVSKVDAETMRHYQTMLVDSEMQLARDQKLLGKLKELSLDELRQTIPTAAPDTILASMMEELSKAETQLAGLRSDYGEDHADVRRTKAVVESLQKRINDRLKGILGGMEAKLDALKATVDENKKKIEINRVEDSKVFEQYQPFFQLKRDLETLQKDRDELMTRLTREKIESSLIQNGAGKPAKP